jgi:hypothetical protein
VKTGPAVLAAFAVLAALPAGCAPDLPSADSLITAPRILAVRADPAEGKPGATVAFSALVAAPPGASAGAPSWSFCEAPAPLTEDNIVADACVWAPGSGAAGTGTNVVAQTPDSGCSLFGPDAPPGGLRPRDPDSTGGYYQPLRVALAAAEPAFTLVRISCDLANASSSAAAAFAQAYLPNRNPQLGPLEAATGGSTVALDAVPAGARVTFTASWDAASAEAYAYYDAASDAVVTRRESMTVAWYASAGALDREATGRAEDDPATTSDDGWAAPAVAGSSRLWIVLRDSRGGVDFATYDIVTVASR